MRANAYHMLAQAILYSSKGQHAQAQCKLQARGLPFTISLLSSTACLICYEKHHIVQIELC